MSKSILVLGRQPALGLAELESLYGPGKVRRLGSQAAEVDVDPCLLAFDRLGGSVKFCKLLTVQETTSWKQLEKFLVSVSPGHAATMPEGKMQLGLSQIGFDITLQKQEAAGLNIKKAVRATGRSVRLIPNKTPVLSSPQVIHNHLTGPTGWELVLIRDGNQTIVAQTVKEQDIEAYTHRDRERPRRDAKVGMLPPKLAQIIINLAVGKIPEHALASICDIPADQPIPRPNLPQTILDPFCGTGVMLQEALLMGYHASGTDLDARMVSYAQTNLDWLAKDYEPYTQRFQLSVGDATNYRWEPLVDAVATETYLGRPFTERPSGEMLAQTAAECNLIIKKFLRNIHSKLKPGTGLCIAVPAWQTSPDKFRHLPLIDQIEDMGYNRVSFEHAREQDLIYYRTDQIVARELLVLIRK